MRQRGEPKSVRKREELLCLKKPSFYGTGLSRQTKLASEPHVGHSTQRAGAILGGAMQRRMFVFT
jgi:hypothetical protein